jgi:hypothetical protein
VVATLFVFSHKNIILDFFLFLDALLLYAPAPWGWGYKIEDRSYAVRNFLIELVLVTSIKLKNRLGG